MTAAAHPPAAHYDKQKRGARTQAKALLQNFD